MTDHLADIRKYDALADADVVARLADYLAPALKNRDSALVACSDEQELARVRKNWCMGKLGVFDRERCDTVIGWVCETMAGDNHKDRVTFYYLVAKHLDRLGVI